MDQRPRSFGLEPVGVTPDHWQRHGSSPWRYHGDSGGSLAEANSAYGARFHEVFTENPSGGSLQAYPVALVGWSGSAKASGGSGFHSPLSVGVRRLHGIFGDQKASGGGSDLSSSS
jgi:hypothetical protein